MSKEAIRVFIPKEAVPLLKVERDRYTLVLSLEENDDYWKGISSNLNQANRLYVIPETINR